MIFYDEKRAVQSLTIDCSILGKTKLIAWNEPPADGVTFAAVDGLPQGMKFDARSDGLYLVRPGMIIIVK